MKNIATKLYSGKSIKELVEFEKKETLDIGVDSIDKHFGFPTGYYIVVGNQGIGKSWFALWLIRQFNTLNQIRSVYFSLEMPEPLVRKRILQQWSDLTKVQLEKGTSTSKALEMLGSDVIIVDEFYPQETKYRTPRNFEEWVDEYYKHGYRCFIMDHFHELGGASNNDSNQRTVERWGLTFQKLCKKYPDIWLIVFAQPKSSDYKKGLLDRNSLRGSKALIDKCDYVLSLNNQIQIKGRVKENDRGIILYLDKTRYTEQPNKCFALHFHETGNFYSQVTP